MTCHDSSEVLRDYNDLAPKGRLGRILTRERFTSAELLHLPHFPPSPRMKKQEHPADGWTLHPERPRSHPDAAPRAPPGPALPIAFRREDDAPQDTGYVRSQRSGRPQPTLRPKLGLVSDPRGSHRQMSSHFRPKSWDRSDGLLLGNDFHRVL